MTHARIAVEAFQNSRGLRSMSGGADEYFVLA